MTLYRTIELRPGVELRPAPSGRAAELVAPYHPEPGLHHGPPRLSVILGEAELERLLDGIREALE